MSGTSKKNDLPFEVLNSEIQGYGGFAVRRIRKGQRIIEYVGERIGPEEEQKRYIDEEMERHHTFLFSVDDNVSIDAAVGGNEARFINHSCDPNCEAVDEEGRIYIEAIQNIQPGTELLYDYGFEVDDEDLAEEILRYPCRCGSKKCRGTILKYKKKHQKEVIRILSQHGRLPGAGDNGKAITKSKAKKKAAR